MFWRKWMKRYLKRSIAIGLLKKINRRFGEMVGSMFLTLSTSFAQTFQSETNRVSFKLCFGVGSFANFQCEIICYLPNGGVYGIPE